MANPIIVRAGGGETAYPTLPEGQRPVNHATELLALFQSLSEQIGVNVQWMSKNGLLWDENDVLIGVKEDLSEFSARLLELFKARIESLQNRHTNRADSEIQQIVEKENGRAGVGFGSKWALVVLSDLCSFMRNFLSAVAKNPGAASAAKGAVPFGVLGGACNLLSGLMLAQDGIVKALDAWKKGDRWGVIEEGLKGIGGLGVATTGPGLFLAWGAGAAHGISSLGVGNIGLSTALVAPAVTAIITGGFCAYIAFGLLGAVQAYDATKFGDQLDKELQSGKDRRERLRYGLEFLDGCYRNEKTRAVDPVKWAAFERRVGSTLAAKVRDEGRWLLDKLEKGDDPLAEDLAAQLIDEIKAANSKRKKNGYFLMLVALLGLISIILLATNPALAMLVLSVCTAFLFFFLDQPHIEKIVFSTALKHDYEALRRERDAIREKMKLPKLPLPGQGPANQLVV